MVDHGNNKRVMNHSNKTSAFASFDVETDGNNPMQHSMRSIGIALFSGHTSKMVDTFYVTIKPLPGYTVEPSCMINFWDKHPNQWESVNTDTVDVKDAMTSLSNWLLKHSKHYCIKWAAGPCNFDWMFLKCYYEKYGPINKYDIGFFCHDITSLIRAYIVMHNIKNKREFMTSLSNEHEYTHNALDDAIYQGVSYMSIRNLLSFTKIKESNINTTSSDEKFEISMELKT